MVKGLLLLIASGLVLLYAALSPGMVSGIIAYVVALACFSFGGRSIVKGV